MHGKPASRESVDKQHFHHVDNDPSEHISTKVCEKIAYMGGKSPELRL